MPAEAAAGAAQAVAEEAVKEWEAEEAEDR